MELLSPGEVYEFDVNMAGHGKRVSPGPSNAESTLPAAFPAI